MKVCAYCSNEGPLTREHIWPSALIKKYDQGLKTYNGLTEKYYTGDAVIKDVCEVCNNEKLSKLDAYLSEIYDQHFYRIVQPGEAVSFSYNYEMLLRSLLKISFNSVRANNPKESKNVKLHREFSRYILEGGYHQEAMIRLQIVTASRRVNLEDGSEEIFEPSLMRCTETTYDSKLSHRFMIRMIGINSFWFYLIVPYKKEPRHQWDSFMDSFSAWNHLNGILLGCGKCEVIVPANKTTWLVPQLLGKLFTAAGSS